MVDNVDIITPQSQKTKPTGKLFENIRNEGK